MLTFLLIFAVIGYLAYRILKRSIPQMKAQAQLNKLVAEQLPTHLGGTQPSYDFDESLNNDHRAKEINQLERVWENGYRVTPEGDWRG